MLAILTVSAWLASVQVQAVTVGVQAGNTFTYKVNSASGAHELDGASNFTMTISNVTGDVVGFQEAIKYSNGTSTKHSGYINLEYGNNTGTAWLLFDGNLQVGEPVYPGWPIWANESVMVNGRPTGHTIINDTYVNITNGPQGYMTANVYADQATGATVNVSVSLTAGTTSSFNYYLIATNAFKAVPEFSPIALVIVMSTLTATTAAIAYRKKVKLPP